MRPLTTLKAQEFFEVKISVLPSVLHCMSQLGSP